MNKKIYCDRCGTLMKKEPCEGSFGKEAKLLVCPKCYYQYEIGFRFNPYIQQYVKYYKYI